MNIPHYDETKPGQIFPPSKTIYNFAVALVNNLIDKINVIFGFYPSVKGYGALGLGEDSIVEDTAAFLEAIAAETGTIYVPEGNYYISEDLLIAAKGIGFLGAGADKSIITIAHSDGPGLHFQTFDGFVRNLTIEASAEREAGAAGTNCGILVAPLDEEGAGGHALNFVLDQVEITNQPSHGIVLVGFTIGGALRSFDIHDNLGHGIFVTNGVAYLGVVNEYTGGFLEIGPGNLKQNGGHSVCAGSDTSTNDIATRVHVFNVDCVRNALEAGVRYAAYDMFIFGSNCRVENSGLGGFDAGNDPAIGCLLLAGTSVFATNNRYVDHTGSAIYAANLTGATTTGVVVEEMHIIQSGNTITDISETNPAVVTYTGADNYANADRVEIVSVGGMTEVNNRTFLVANLNVGAKTFELSGIDASGFTPYTTGGLVRRQLDPAVLAETGVVHLSVSSFDQANIWNLQRRDDGLNVPGSVHQKPELTVKRATQTVTGSDVLVNDDELFFPVVAGETVAFKAVLCHIGNDTADFKCTFTAPTGATVRWGPTAAQEGIGGTVAQVARAAEAVTIAFGGSTSARFIEVFGWVKAGTIAGNVRLQWAQNTADAVNTQVLGGSLGGSHLLVWRE